MDSKLLKLCIAVAVAAGLNACDTGEHTNLDCDPATYQSECLDPENLMVCGADGKLTVDKCPNKDCAETTMTNADGTTIRSAACGTVTDRCADKANVCKDATTLSKCDPATGEMTVTETCANGCEAGACKAAEDKCAGKANVCIDATTLSKCDPATGEMTVTETCANGCNATTNDCNADAENKCEGKANVCKDSKVLSKCNAESGEMTDEETCAYGCDLMKDACIEAPKEAACETPAETQCAGNVLQTCTANEDGEGNTWKNAETSCPYGCDAEAKQCKEAPAGGDCNIDTDETRCADDVVQTCTAKTEGEGAEWINATEACQLGCNTETGACNEPPKCTANVCAADGITLSRCDLNTGKAVDETCAFGCGADEANVIDCKAAPKEDACDTVGASQCAENVVQTCTANEDGEGNTWKNADNACNYGCKVTDNKAACTEAPALETCNIDTDNKRCVEGDISQTCKANDDGVAVWVSEAAACAHGCNETTGECNEAADDNTCSEDEEGKTRCNAENAKIVQTCTNGQWTDAAEECTEKCGLNDKNEASCVTTTSAAVCGNNVIEEGEECDGTAAITKTCTDLVVGASGEGTVKCNECKFDTTECTMFKEGVKCDVDKFVEGCNGTQLVYCSGSYGVQYIECAQGNATCGILDVGEHGTWADCLYKDKECETAGEEGLRCDEDEFGYPYSDNFVCYNDTISGKNYALADSYLFDDEENYEECEYSCLSATGKCGKIVENEGEDCNPDEVEPTCINERKAAVSCEETLYGDYISASECTANETCAVVTDGDAKASICFAAEDKCTNLGAESKSCYNDYLLDNKCVAGDDGSNYNVIVKNVKCAHGCNAETKSCNTLVDNEGDACTAASFTASCDKNIAINCTSSAVTATQCEANEACVINDKKQAECIETCTNVGEKTISCEDIWGLVTYAVYSECKAVDGINVMVETDSERCNNECNTTDGCVKLSDKEGTECTASACDEKNSDIYLQCDEDEYVAFSCKEQLGENFVCGVADREAFCYEACTTPDEKRTVCKTGSYYSYVAPQTCKDNFYVNEVDKDGYIVMNEICAGSCNTAGNACADVKISACSETTTITCPVAGTECYALDGKDKGCANPCTNVGDKLTKCVDATSSSDAYEVIYTCMGDANKSVFIRTNYGDDCANGCNADKTGCAEEPVIE